MDRYFYTLGKNIMQHEATPFRWSIDGHWALFWTLNDVCFWEDSKQEMLKDGAGSKEAVKYKSCPKPSVCND